MRLEEGRLRDFPGGLVVKTLPSKGRGVGWSPGQGAKILHAFWPKNQSIKQNIVTNSIKTLKMIHIKKVLKKK